GRPSWPPSPPVFCPISTHFTATPGVPPAPTALHILAVSAALPQVSRGLSPPTREAAYARFTPSNSGQRSHPTYYRGCWHVVSRCFFPGYRPRSPPGKAVYTPKGVVPHAASLDQACAHCQNSLTAASRRSLGRVSVPVWLAVLSDQLRITALVGPYPANQLIRRDPLHRRPKGLSPTASQHWVSCGLSGHFWPVSPTRGQVSHALLTRPPL